MTLSRTGTTDGSACIATLLKASFSKERQWTLSGIEWGAGGLVDQPRGGRQMGGMVMAGPSTYGLPPKPQPGSILRSRVRCTSRLPSWFLPSC